jgi:hypothetical protein
MPGEEATFEGRRVVPTKTANGRQPPREHNRRGPSKESTSSITGPKARSARARSELHRQQCGRVHRGTDGSHAIWRVSALGADSTLGVAVARRSRAGCRDVFFGVDRAKTARNLYMVGSRRTFITPPRESPPTTDTTSCRPRGSAGSDASSTRGRRQDQGRRGSSRTDTRDRTPRADEPAGSLDPSRPSTRATSGCRSPSARAVGCRQPA